MNTITRITRIGNSKGIRLPAGLLKRYRIGDTLIMEEMIEGILLRPTGPAVAKLSWNATARQMVAEAESWTEWDSASADGLEKLPWTTSKEAMTREGRAIYRGTKRKARR